MNPELNWTQAINPPEGPRPKVCVITTIGSKRDKTTRATNYNMHTRDLAELHRDQAIFVQNPVRKTWSSAGVTDQGNTPRTYIKQWQLPKVAIPWYKTCLSGFMREWLNVYLIMWNKIEAVCVSAFCMGQGRYATQVNPPLGSIPPFHILSVL